MLHLRFRSLALQDIAFISSIDPELSMVFCKQTSLTLNLEHRWKCSSSKVKFRVSVRINGQPHECTVPFLVTNAPALCQLLRRGQATFRQSATSAKPDTDDNAWQSLPRQNFLKPFPSQGRRNHSREYHIANFTTPLSGDKLATSRIL